MVIQGFSCGNYLRNIPVYKSAGNYGIFFLYLKWAGKSSNIPADYFLQEIPQENSIFLVV
jgi:hypothetical protein